MDMQGMDMHDMGMHGMHNTFWRENQVVVTFHSEIPLYSSDGVYQGDHILESLNLESQRCQLNEFLAGQQKEELNCTLRFCGPEGCDYSSVSPSATKDENRFIPPPGVYLFGLDEPIQTQFGSFATSVVAFFTFAPNTGDVSSEMSGDMSGMDMSSGMSMTAAMGGANEPDSEKRRNLKRVAPIVQAFNEGSSHLYHMMQVPIRSASPHWLWGGTGFIPQGCPVIPPRPVDPADASRSSWHFDLPELPEALQALKGEGVTVFVLDALPDKDVISSAVADSTRSNGLLADVFNNPKITLNYDIWDAWVASGEDPGGIPELAVGKDAYGRHVAFQMPDHGLFITGIVHDIAPDAHIECIRVMGNYCVGDSDLFLKALDYIQQRISIGGDLYGKPVVINLSLVMPTKQQARDEGIDPDLGGVTNDILTSVRDALRVLIQKGATVVASAGNEGDQRHMHMMHTTNTRPGALYPAAFVNAPDNLDGIIPVGAVDRHGHATSYSCYPGSKGIATYGGDIPTLSPPQPPAENPTIVASDSMRGIYSSARYPRFSEDAPEPEYPAPPERHGWAYWAGTSFATPIITAVAARIREQMYTSGVAGDVLTALVAATQGSQTRWDRLDPETTGVEGGSIQGPMLLAKQSCSTE